MEISEEQRKEIEAKLAKMSPEEIQQLQAQQCIFCQIIDGKIPAKTIYEDHLVKVVLDINPASPGHCLILPKEHYMVLPQVPKEITEHMFKIAKQVSHTLLRSLKVDGTSWFVANGQLAGQRAQHVMVHVIPRIDQDGIGLMIPKNDLSEDEKTTLKNLVSPVINAALGKKVEVPKLETKEEEKNLPVAKPEPEPPAAEQQPSNDVAAAPDDNSSNSIEEKTNPENVASETSSQDEEDESTPEEEMQERSEETESEEEQEESGQKLEDTDDNREDDDSEEDDQEQRSGKPNLDDITRFLSG